MARKHNSNENKKVRFSDGAKNKAALLFEIYSLLYKRYGAQHWWPADGAFEVAVGAILTQNTSWANVEKAIFNIKREGLLSPVAIYRIKPNRLARLIRPCGYYNIKAKRLKGFINYLFSKYSGELANMRRTPTGPLRREMLKVKGIGPETADSIILYALKRPVFVVDAYTRRIMNCQGIVSADSVYEEIQSVFMDNLPMNVKLYNEYHALLVEHAKRVCRTVPRCQECILHVQGRSERRP